MKTLVIFPARAQIFCKSCFPLANYLHSKHERNCDELKNQHFHRAACKVLLSQRASKSYGNHVLRDEEHGLRRASTLAGMMILCRPFDEDADSSVLRNFDPVSKQDVKLSRGTEIGTN
jgi:hypothetical protein